MLIRLNIIAFVLGAGLLQQQAVLPNIMWAWLLLIVVSVFLLWQIQIQFPIPVITNKILLFIFFLGLGFCWAATLAHWRLADSLPHKWEGQDIQLIGVIASLPNNGKQRVRFQFDVERVLTAHAIVPKHISLSWYRKNNHAGITLPEMKAGERWQITTRLKRPHSNVNPHGFDFEAWALQRNIRANGYIRQSDQNIRLDKMVNHPNYWIERFRQNIRSRFKRTLSNQAYAGILITLATGDQQSITREQWQVLTRTGTNHLMAISGLHITLVSSLAFALVYRLWCWSPYLLLRLPARKAAIVAGFFVALVYALLSGFAIPAQRAFYMLVVVAITLWRGRITSPPSVLAWALLWVVILDPWASNSPGFWLSFSAIAIIMWITVGRIGAMHWLPSWTWIQWSITLGLMPLLLGLFQQVSLVSPIANAFAIPLISLAVVPLTLLATIPWFDFLLIPAHIVLSTGMDMLQSLSDMQQAVWQQHVPPIWTIVVGIIGVYWILLPSNTGIGLFSGFPARWIGIIAILPMFLVPPPKPNIGELWVTVLDVGQGLSVIARTAHHTLLFDSGPSFGETNSGDRIILPFLRRNGITRLDAMIVSHADSDHSGGALTILNSIPVSKLISSLNTSHPIQQANNSHRCHAGESWDWDGVDFELLYPSRQDYDNRKHNTNELSCVLRITTKHGSILLPADIGRKSEQLLLTRLGDVLASTILVAPHHGSKTSSSKKFIQHINPKLTIFTTGYRNRFGHPAKEVVARYRRLDSKLLRTDKEGAVLLRFERGGIEVDTWRTLNQRYWQQNKCHTKDLYDCQVEP